MPPSHQRRSRERSLSITPRSPATRAQAARICQVGDQSDAVTSSVALGESLIAFLSSTERSCIISYCSRVTILDDRWISTVPPGTRVRTFAAIGGTPRSRSNDQLFLPQRTVELQQRLEQSVRHHQATARLKVNTAIRRAADARQGCHGKAVGQGIQRQQPSHDRPQAGRPRLQQRLQVVSAVGDGRDRCRRHHFGFEPRYGFATGNDAASVVQYV